MKMQTGLRITADVKEVKGKSIRFVDDNDRVLFEVRMLDDKSIEVRGVETSKHDGKIYTEALIVMPRYANCIEVHRAIYE